MLQKTDVLQCLGAEYAKHARSLNNLDVCNWIIGAMHELYFILMSVLKTDWTISFQRFRMQMNIQLNSTPTSCQNKTKRSARCHVLTLVYQTCIKLKIKLG